VEKNSPSFKPAELKIEFPKSGNVRQSLTSSSGSIFVPSGRKYTSKITYTVPFFKNFIEGTLPAYRVALETKLSVSTQDFKLLNVYQTTGYGESEKSRKNKLGQLFNCTVNGIDIPLLCRVMKFDRISNYQFEGYLTEIARLHMLKLNKFIIFPRAVLLD
jgi:hypothetical protein